MESVVPLRAPPQTLPSLVVAKASAWPTYYRLDVGESCDLSRGDRACAANRSIRTSCFLRTRLYRRCDAHYFIQTSNISPGNLDGYAVTGSVLEEFVLMP